MINGWKNFEKLQKVIKGWNDIFQPVVMLEKMVARKKKLK